MSFITVKFGGKFVVTMDWLLVWFSKRLGGVLAQIRLLFVHIVDNEEELFNPNCVTVNLLDNLRRRCGCQKGSMLPYAVFNLFRLFNSIFTTLLYWNKVLSYLFTQQTVSHELLFNVKIVTICICHSKSRPGDVQWRRASLWVFALTQVEKLHQWLIFFGTKLVQPD